MSAAFVKLVGSAAMELCQSLCTVYLVDVPVFEVKRYIWYPCVADVLRTSEGWAICMIYVSFCDSSMFICMHFGYRDVAFMWCHSPTLRDCSTNSRLYPLHHHIHILLDPLYWLDKAHCVSSLWKHQNVIHTTLLQFRYRGTVGVVIFGFVAHLNIYEVLLRRLQNITMYYFLLLITFPSLFSLLSLWLGLVIKNIFFSIKYILSRHQHVWKDSPMCIFFWSCSPSC